MSRSTLSGEEVLAFIEARNTENERDKENVNDTDTMSDDSYQDVWDMPDGPQDIEDDDPYQEGTSNQNAFPREEEWDPRRNREDTPEEKKVLEIKEEQGSSAEPTNVPPLLPDATPVHSSPRKLRSRADLHKTTDAGVKKEEEQSPEEYKPPQLRERRTLGTLNASNNKTPESVPKKRRLERTTPKPPLTPQCVNAPAGMTPSPNSSIKRRKDSKAAELKERKRRSPMVLSEPDEEEEDNTGNEHERDLRKRPVIIVIDKNLPVEKRKKDRVLRVQNFEFKIPKVCSEAIRGEKYGGWTRDKKLGIFPGVPNRKFSKDQLHSEYGQVDQEWPVQSVYEGDDPETYKVFYEGWTNDAIAERPHAEVRESAPEFVEEMFVRNEFYLKMREVMVEYEKEFNDELISRKKPDNVFWLYLDLSYFHSMKNKEYELSPIWYMHILKSPILPPRFAYTPLNILNADSYNILKKRRESKHWDKLKAEVSLCVGQKDYKGPCQSGKDCVCNARYTLLYGEADGFNGHRFSKNIIPREDGTIDVTKFRLEDARVIMECSDACKCDSRCPRRQLQRGQIKPLVVFYENPFKGFGVRAAANFKSGEFVCEYTGIARCKERIDYELDEHAYIFATKPSPPRTKWIPYDEREKPVKKAKKCEETDTIPPYEEELELNRRVLGDAWKSNDMSYEAGFHLLDTSMVISANSVGNIARFINHSCDSNTAFMEVYSRRYETDVLVPRIAVYAIKDIKIGEEVTTNYYANHNGKKSSISCQCKTALCKKFLPDVFH